MKEIEVGPEEAAAIEARLDATEKRIKDFMQRHRVKSAEALVLTDPPVSDVDAD